MKYRAIRTTFAACLILFTLALLPVQGAESQIKETVLPNGLKVLTKEVHAAPVVSFNVWYRVGSRNEQLGKTGLSHLLEHMMFKGTKTFKKGEIDRLVRRNGGISNAGTWIDFTYYWQTLSSDKLELSMRIESDRMVNSLMEAKELEAEMTVVRSELEGGENSPDSLVYYEMLATAFKAHPYMWPTIGWRNDVESITREDVWKYYKTYYMPNNAVVVIVGDFETEKALAMVKKYFGKIRRGPEPPKVTAVEPPQMGERRAEVRKPGNASRVMLGYHIPAISHPDIYPLDILEVVLSSGASSRLYQALVDKQFATEAWAGANYSKDPNLFLLGATARDGVDIRDVEAALLAEIERVKSEPITDSELRKAVNQLEADYVYTDDSVTAQGRRIGRFEIMHTWRLMDTYLDDARKVTKDDVLRVARQYLVDRNKTTVTFIPEQPAAKSAVETTSQPWKTAVAAYRQDNEYHEPRVMAAKDRKTEPRGTGIKPTRVVLDNGLTVLVHENRSNPTVSIEGSLSAGGMLEPRGKEGLASMTAGMLMRGTQSRTRQQIAAEKDFVGMSVNIGADTESATFTGRSLSKHFDLMLELLSDSFRNPTFPQDELEKLRAMRLSGIKQEQDDPEAMAFRAFKGAVFTQGHPYHAPTAEEALAATSSITREDILGFYGKHYGPRGMILAMVGDVDTQEAVEKIRKYFGDWTGGSVERPEIPDTPLQAEIVRKTIQAPEKSQSDIVLGYAGGLKRSDPDFYSANVMNFILGGGGALASRMGDEIRDNMGLAYNVYSWFNAALGAGPWYAHVGTNPGNADKAVEAMLNEMRKMREKGATQEELDEAVDYLTGSFPVRLEKNASIVAVLHAMELYGLGMDYIDKYPSLYRSVTLEQVNEAAKKYLHPDRYTLVIAGP